MGEIKAPAGTEGAGESPKAEKRNGGTKGTQCGDGEKGVIEVGQLIAPAKAAGRVFFGADKRGGFAPRLFVEKRSREACGLYQLPGERSHGVSILAVMRRRKLLSREFWIGFRARMASFL